MRWLVRTVAAVISLASTNPSVLAQPLEPASLRGDSAQTRKRLTEADQKLVAGKPADAIDDLQRILDESAYDLVSIDGKQYRTAVWLSQQILSRLPQEALKSYQDQIDAPARKLLETGKASRDLAALWQLHDRYFVSRPADEGAVLLGDLLFERGDFRMAELVWRRLLPGAGDLTHPSSKIEASTIAARLVLAAVFAGDLDRAKTELAAFKTKYGEARGTLAGKTGGLASILDDVLRAPPRLHLGRIDGGAWPCFGGCGEHSAFVGVRLPAEWNHEAKAVELPGPVRGHTPSAFGHAVVVGAMLFVTDGRQLYGVDLRTGRRTQPTRVMEDIPGEKQSCPSITAAGDRLYVRSGPSLFTAQDALGAGRPESNIICYAIRPGSPTGLEQQWRISPPAAEGRANAVWEGAPQVAGRRMWAAYMRLEGGRIVHGIACYDPADPAERPERPAWAEDVCESTMTPANENRKRQELVTIAGRHVVFCSNTGAIAALNAATGRRAWAFRYSRARAADPNRTSDPAPAVAYGGRLFAAPADSDHVYALDVETGEPLWDYPTAAGARILGVAAGRLLLAVNGDGHHTRGLDLETGSDRGQSGWAKDNPGAPAIRGCGFATDTVAIYPTNRGLCTFNPRDGAEHLFPLRLPSGACNIVYSDGMIIAVTATQVLIFRSEANEFSPGVTANPPEDDRLRFMRLAALAERELADGELARARDVLAKAARSELPAPYRAWAAARLLLLTPAVADESNLPADLRSVLTPDLDDQWLVSPQGLPCTLASLVRRHLGREPPRASASSASQVQPADDRPRLRAEKINIERARSLPAGSFPLQPIKGATSFRHVYYICGNELCSIPLSTGADKRYTASALFTHIAETPEGFIAAGPQAVAVFTSGPSPGWIFRVPVTDPLPALAGQFRLYTTEQPPPPDLTDFCLRDNWLLARCGPGRLIAFDLHHRRVAWVLGADGRLGFQELDSADSPQFGPEFSLGPENVVAQLSTGRRWLIRTVTGEVRDAPDFLRETTRVWWAIPPVQMEGSLVVSDGPGLVRMLKFSTRQVRWSFSEPARESSLSGEPPQVRAWGDVLVVAVKRNFGVELRRLDVSTGRPSWKQGPAFLDADCVNLAEADCDGERLYIAAGDSLTAIDLFSGKSAWTAALPAARGARWVVRAGRECVVAYPASAIPHAELNVVWHRLAREASREPAAWRLPVMALGLYDAWVDRKVQVRTFDLESGRQLGRVDMPAHGPAVTVCFDRDQAVVAAGEHVYWVK